MRVEGLTGPQIYADGAVQTPRMGRTGELIISELHGRFYEQNYRGNTFTFGSSNTALVAANATATGLSTSAQPVIGLWNPSTSVNLVILQAIVCTTTIANTAVSPNGFVWVYSTGNFAISTGSNPINCKSLVAPGGSAAKVFSLATALTGLTTSLVVLRAVPFCAINAAGAATAVSVIQSSAVENIDGGLIVPPGGVLGIMNTTSTTTVSVSTGILWEEVAV